MQSTSNTEGDRLGRALCARAVRGTRSRWSAAAMSVGVTSSSVMIGTLALLVLQTSLAFAHGVAEGDKGYIQEITGVHLLSFMYLGAKHMVTGYDHLLFLFGVVFFLYKAKHIGIYVSLFALGHSTTMLIGVLMGTNVSSYLIDA